LFVIVHDAAGCWLMAMLLAFWCRFSCPFLLLLPLIALAARDTDCTLRAIRIKYHYHLM